jgi:HD-like signal output (HDOD) protein
VSPDGRQESASNGRGEASSSQGDIPLNRSLSELGELSSPPGHIVQFNTVLTATPVDLKQLRHVLDSDPAFAEQVIKLCNSSLFNLPSPVSSLEQAVLMLGTDHLRTLVLTCALVESVGNLVRPHEQYRFWERGFLTAAVSEGLARRAGHTEVELAYFGGLLHDLGTLPLLCAESQDRLRRDSIDLGDGLVGVGHCALGRRLGILWGFPLPLLEVFEFHHEPQKARDYKTLVYIVALAEQFCRSQPLGANEKPQAGPNRNLLWALTPDAPLEAQQVVAEGMRLDYRRMCERLKAGLGGVIARGPQAKRWPA